MATATAPRIDSIDFAGNPYKTILKLALPTVIAMLAQSVVNDIDGIFFKHLPSPEDSNGQAALLPSLLVVWLFGGSLSAISVGTQALTARRYAEGDRKGAGAVLTNSAFFCLIAGPLASIVAYFCLPMILRGQTNNPEVLAIAISYSRWRVLGIVSMAMTMGIKSFFDGVGRTSVHLVASIIMNLSNVLLCYMFIFGHFGAPRMGPEGAGFSAFVATWIGLFIVLGYSLVIDRKRGEGAESERFHLYERSALSKSLIWGILKLSIPGGLATLVMMFGFGLFSRIAGQLDDKGEAIYGAATTDVVLVLKPTFTACIAFGTATATLVGQSLARKDPKGAERFGWASVRLGLVLFGLLGLAEGVLFTPQILRFITDSPGVQHVLLVPMRMMGIITPVIAVAMILSEALFGAGNPAFVAIAQFVLVFCVLLPLAYVFAIHFDMKLVGIWAAACIYSGLAAAAMTFKFREGKWKEIRL